MRGGDCSCGVPCSVSEVSGLAPGGGAGHTQYELVRGLQYTYTLASKTYAQALAACQALAPGGTLAEPTSSQANAAIQAAIGGHAWLGIHADSDGSTWRTSRGGDVLSYQNWNPNEGGNPTERCAMITATAGWYDVTCSSTRTAYVCQS